MRDRMKALARGKSICVLATRSGDAPYCSLMAYVTDTACETIYMVTHRSTRKYKNMIRHAAVSLMIDSREKTPRSQVQALTVQGSFRQITDRAEYQRARMRMLEAHPHLSDFMDDADAEIFSIKIDSFLLLNGLSEAHFEAL